MNADKMMTQYNLTVVRKVFFAGLAMLLCYSAKAQKWDEAQLDEVEVDIVKERQINLPPANRNFEKIPPRPSEATRPPFEYSFKPFSFQTPQFNPAIRPLKLKVENPSKVYGGHFSAGYGNYASPYLDAYFNSKRDKNKLVGAHAYYRASGKGPVDGKNSASGTSGISIFGKSFSEQISLSGELGFENRFTHFYGYLPESNPEAGDIKQSYNLFNVSGELSNAKKSNFAYKLGAGFSYLADAYDAKESTVDLTFNAGYVVNDESNINVKAAYALINREDTFVEATPRSLFTVNPSYVFFPVEDLKLSAGLVVAFENDTIDDRGVHVYPDLRASYPLSPSVEAVASLTGGIEKVSLQTMSRENLWLGPNIDIFHTNKLYDFQVALHAKAGNKVSVNGGISFASLKNWYFYKNIFVFNVTGFTEQSKFEPEYNEDATLRTNFFASLGFAQTESAKFLIRGDLYSYSRQDDEGAWHRPTYKVTGDLSFNVYKKLLIGFNLIAQGGMKAENYTTPTTFEVVELEPALDLNARLEYVVSESFSVFVHGNNLTSNQYQVFLNYPVRGLQVLGGLTWRF